VSTPDVTIVVGIYGDRSHWDPLAQRAIASAEQQGPVILSYHPSRLDYARNEGAAAADTSWLIFLDADDELTPGYVSRMLTGSGDLRWPAVKQDWQRRPRLHMPNPNFVLANHMGPGVLIGHDWFDSVGGFDDLPVLEDWDLYIRLYLKGAVMRPCPEAVYLSHDRPHSRNKSEIHDAVYLQIYEKYRRHDLMWHDR
jgi:glycosyltransferase involved in cell wall biosynthesis